MIRDGSWDNNAGVFRSAFRSGSRPSDTFFNLGFRPALVSIPPEPEPALTIDDLVAGMVSIPAGTFVMGSPDSEVGRFSDEGPQTHVTISEAFWISKYEVTQGQYEEVMSSNPALYTDVGLDAPVEQVTWNDAVEFCRLLTARELTAGRLPAGVLSKY